jgi:hypothetical protein
VASHFILDWIVHVPELPLAGEDSRKFGLALWDAPAQAIAVELVVVAAGLLFYSRTARAARWPMVAYVAVLTPLMIGGQWLATNAPPIRVLAWSWIGGGILLSAVAYAIDRLRR